MPGNIFKKAYCAGLLLVFLTAPAGAWAQEAKAAIDMNQSLKVDADRLDAYNDKRMVVFSGNVVAVQGARTIYSESLTIHYKDDKKKSRQPSALTKESGNIEKIEARGKVKIVEGQRTATGNFAVFEQDAQKITLTGNAVLKEGENSVAGDKVTVFLEENRGVVEGGENKRVSATIYPGEKK